MTDSVTAGGRSLARATPNRLNVRRLAVSEAPLFTTLAERLFRESYADEHTAADMDAYIADAFGTARQEAELAEPSACVLLIEDSDGTPLGYAHLRDGEAPDVIEARHPREIARFYVDRRWHGRGVAQALMSACVADALSRKAHTLWLAVWQHNRRAVAFYEKSGFRAVAEQTFRLGAEVELDWVMVRPVDDGHAAPTSSSAS